MTTESTYRRSSSRDVFVAGLVELFFALFVPFLGLVPPIVGLVWGVVHYRRTNDRKYLFLAMFSGFLVLMVSAELLFLFPASREIRWHEG